MVVRDGAAASFPHWCGAAKTGEHQPILQAREAMCHPRMEAVRFRETL
jgi:hypothetical protein